VRVFFESTKEVIAMDAINVEAITRNILDSVVGFQVRVGLQIDSEVETRHGPQLAVVGILEGARGSYRVLSGPQTDRSVCYCYFTMDEVVSVADRRQTDKGEFDCGSVVAIHIGGKTTHPYSDIEHTTIVESPNGKPFLFIL
jgi:hypothetical protein